MIRELIKRLLIGSHPEQQQESKIVLMNGDAPQEPDLRVVGLFSEVVDEKVAELVHAMLYLDEVNRVREEEKPIGFYVCTYGGSADDMFALYDVMRQVRATTEIHTVGMGKVMSAGVLILAAGTKGQRKIGKYCRVMIHGVMAGQHGYLADVENEFKETKSIQKMYVQALADETSMS